MIERLENIEKRYNEIMDILTKPEVLGDIKKTMALSKEQASLRENYEAYQEYKKVLENIKAAKELMKDPEMGEFANLVTFSPTAKKKLAMIQELGYTHFPICIAKTQYSFSTNAKLINVPKDFEFHVQDIVINAGAEMLVVISGEIMRMPGLPKQPQALHIDIVDGEIEGLS